VSGRAFTRQVKEIKALDGVSLSISEGETLGLVGESGCGKTTLARLLLLLDHPTGGAVFFQGKEMDKLSRSETRKYRASVQAVFQDPLNSLSPRMRAGQIIVEPMVINKSVSRVEARDRARELLETVGLGSADANSYPHEFSTGQRQRIALARALSLNPELIILDEPVSALDVSLQAQMLNLLRDVQEKFGLSLLLIAHDMAVVHHMSNRIAVMYSGRIVEMAESDELYRNPVHPYTKALFSVALVSYTGRQIDSFVLSGEVPSPLDPPSGCSFHPRCPDASSTCSQAAPSLKDIGGGHQVACWMV